MASRCRAKHRMLIVFQSFALFPWMTVLENVEAPLEARGMRPMERHKRALRIIDAVGLDGFENAYPKELSGGMKQRVGVARALVVELWLEHKIPTRAIFIVTHNIEEAVVLADRIIVLGRNPAHIHADIAVDLSYPRDRKTPDFINLVDTIYRVLTRPDDKQDHVHTATSGGAAVSHRPIMLPHTRPGGVAGLLEILVDQVAEQICIVWPLI